MSQKKKFTDRAAASVARLWHGIMSHPVELLVLLHATVSAICSGTPWWQLPAYYTAFAVVAALCLSFHRSKRWAAVAYWAVLPLYAFTSFLPDRWHSMTEYGLLTALLPAVYLLACGKNDFNARFFSMARSLVVAMGIGMLTFILLLIIDTSIQTLFSPSWHRAEEYMAIVCFVLLTPLLFIGMESGSGEVRASKLEEALVNWLLTPALLVYNVVLYVYLAVIAIRWELPKGSVATMVSMFIGVAVALRWLRPMLLKQPLGWYFRWFGLIALPLVVLFWVATGHRIGQYGITIDRCILVATGMLMTVFAVLSLFKTSHGSYWFLAGYLVAGLLVAVGGPLSARQVSLRSQIKVVRQNAEKMGLISDDGTLSLPVRNEADTVYRREHRAIYQAMKYLGDDLADTTAVQKYFGVTRAQYLDHLSRKTADYARAWSVDCYDDSEGEVIDYYVETIGLRPGESVLVDDIGGYSKLYSHIKVDDGKIKLGDTIIEADSVLAVQLAKIGYTLQSNLDRPTVQKHEKELSLYRSPDGQLLMVFEYYQIESDSTGNHITYGEVESALVK
jgi:hypothetical protein